MTSLELFPRKYSASDRMLRVLAFLQAQGPLEKIMMIYDTRSKSMAAAIRYDNDIPVALLDCLSREIGLVEYVQRDGKRAVLGAAEARLRLSGGFRFDGLELTRDVSVWREAMPKLA